MFEKRGRIFDPADGPDWLCSHAMLPVSYHLEDDLFRIFFAGRNEDNHSQIGSVDVSFRDPVTVEAISETPVVRTGKLGLFDDSGVFPSSVVKVNGKLHLYYIGWMEVKRTRYFGSIGLAVSSDRGETFEKASAAPLFSRNDVDPYMTLSSHVMKDDGKYKMWYTSAKEWEKRGSETVPLCHIKYAQSEDGFNWTRNGEICIELRDGDETRIASPSVRKTENRYEMWYCYASGVSGYDVGYAVSQDGLKWTRVDNEAGLEPSVEGWDSKMIAYPHLFEHDGKTGILYNGNGYGETGFGYAIRT